MKLELKITNKGVIEIFQTRRYALKYVEVGSQAGGGVCEEPLDSSTLVLLAVSSGERPNILRPASCSAESHEELSALLILHI